MPPPIRTCRRQSMQLLLDLVLEHVPGPEVKPDAPLQMLVTTIDWSQYVGRIAIGRIAAGTIRSGHRVGLSHKDGSIAPAQIASLMVFQNLDRVEVESASAGDIVALVGLEDVEIGDTVCDLERPLPLPRLVVDEPTLEMIFTINSSPLSGRDGKYVTSRQLRERLYRELEKNVALRVRPLEGTDGFAVAGRGVLHLSVLIETMRREGYEFSVGKPRVIYRVRGRRPARTVRDAQCRSARRSIWDGSWNWWDSGVGSLAHMQPRGDYTCTSFRIPARGLDRAAHPGA